MILFINACVRQASRTRRLADRLLARLGGPVTEIRLWEHCFPSVDERFLAERERLIAEGRFDTPLFEQARLFAAADTVVVAAPYWDLSFPSALKQYFEQICVLGLTFKYVDDRPVGLCRADKLYYVTTAGGPIYSDEPGYGYVKALAQVFYGIPETVCVKAEGLDLAGADVEGILRDAEDRIDRMFDREE